MRDTTGFETTTQGCVVHAGKKKTLAACRMQPRPGVETAHAHMAYHKNTKLPKKGQHQHQHGKRQL